jgi:hypothetical protein
MVWMPHAQDGLIATRAMACQGGSRQKRRIDSGRLIVAQILNRLYRRFAFGKAFEDSIVFGKSDLLPIENRRYSRVQLCATRRPVDRRPGSHPWPRLIFWHDRPRGFRVPPANRLAFGAAGGHSGCIWQAVLRDVQRCQRNAQHPSGGSPRRAATYAAGPSSFVSSPAWPVRPEARKRPGRTCSPTISAGCRRGCWRAK